MTYAYCEVKVVQGGGVEGEGWRMEGEGVILTGLRDYRITEL